ncbi:hypothetical protein N7510_010384 [Penicillium lagena]|uniref:uncharacterized protein n=1 Tax=Penicillium lagena TaxID=94218 RepID=UPI002540F1A3|nr:uncharacterized protein N7510_010384 [Penicillium lagena]KAJ5605230.1 hypothetical protein N7510_010384 [Penicillium lagena]
MVQAELRGSLTHGAIYLWKCRRRYASFTLAIRGWPTGVGVERNELVELDRVYGGLSGALDVATESMVTDEGVDRDSDGDREVDGSSRTERT